MPSRHEAGKLVYTSLRSGGRVTYVDTGGKQELLGRLGCFKDGAQQYHATQ
jgi:hypothetical protein